METDVASNKWRTPLLVLSSILVLLGSTCGPLFNRLYFLHGGGSWWLSAGLQTAGCPILLLPIVVSYINRRHVAKKYRTDIGQNNLAPLVVHLGDSNSFFLMKFFLYKSSLFVGLIFAALDVFYGYGSSTLPVSTSSLILSSQLAFTAVFAYFLVSQKFNIYIINTIVSLTLGGAILGFQSSSDTPEGESMKAYVMGFVMVVLAALFAGFVYPFIELAYKKAKQEINFSLVMEFNMMVCVFATAFCGVGMFISNDYKEIVQEAEAFDLGEGNYYVVLALIAISWQCSMLGINGVIFCSSSLLSGILLTCAVPLAEVMAIIVFKEKFNAAKGVSLLLSIWGFLSYFYGEMKFMNEAKNSSKLGSPLISQQHDDGIGC